jgi:hypothetical protein
MTIPARPILTTFELETAYQELYSSLSLAEREIWTRYAQEPDLYNRLYHLEMRLKLSEWEGGKPLFKYEYHIGDLTPDDPDWVPLDDLRLANEDFAWLETLIVKEALDRLYAQQERKEQAQREGRERFAQGLDLSWQAFLRTDEEFRIAMRTTQRSNGQYPGPDAMARELGLPRNRIRKLAKEPEFKDHIRSVGRWKKRP